MIISPSPPPQSPHPNPPHPPTQGTDANPTDPRVTSLKAIFPDFDDAVILSVLESTGNDHDRALDVLLGMNDPSFVPPNPPPQQSPNYFQFSSSPDGQRLSQEALDEQLARRLAIEEQNASAQAWNPQGTEGLSMYQPYQSRLGGRNSWGGPLQGQLQTQTQGRRDTMTEFQEGFNRIAESGKKTFSSIVSKVRAKMQEFDQGQGWSRSQNPTPNQSPHPAVAPYSSYAPSQQQGSEQGSYVHPYPSLQPVSLQRQTSQSQPAQVSAYTSSPRSGVLRPDASEPTQPASYQQPSYYDPNTRGYDLYGDDEEIEINDKTTPSPAITASATTQRSATFPHADGLVSSPPSSDTGSFPSHSTSVMSPPNLGLSSSTPLTRSLSQTVSSTRSTTPSAPGGVDFSKLGLLPKRPISLVRPQSPPVSGAGASVNSPCMAIAHSESTTNSQTDREEPEFVENPFEDPK